MDAYPEIDGAASCGPEAAGAGRVIWQAGSPACSRPPRPPPGRRAKGGGACAAGAVRSILFEYNGCRGEPSHERRSAVETHAKSCVDVACGPEYTTREIDAGGGILRATVELYARRGTAGRLSP